jgi:hypothetical protein
MLGKLLKYEIRATARIFLPLYAVLLVYAAIHKIISLLSAPKITAPEAISTFIYVVLIVAVFVVTLVVMIQRFYKNLLSDEGYLMFTLPVKPWKHIVSKLLISMLWTVVSAIVTIISISIVVFEKFFTIDFIQIIQKAISDSLSYMSVSAALFMVELLLAAIVALASSVLIIYASIAIGQLFNKHRILSSLGAFIVLSTVSQILITIVYAVPGFAFFRANASGANDLQAAEPFMHLFIWLFIIVVGLLSAGYFIVTNRILSRRLNLE